MKPKEYPFYLKSTVVLFGLTLLSYALLNLKDILSPIAFSLIIAILLNPLVNRFQKKMPRALAIAASMLIALVIVSGVIYFLSSQIAHFSDAFPLLKAKFTTVLDDTRKLLQRDFGVSFEKQQQLISDAINSGSAMVGHTLGSALGTLALVFLVPVYVFMFLLYKPLVLNFLYEVFADEHEKKVAEVLSQTKMAIQSYMVGLLLEALIVAVMNSAALLILGVEYAVLLGVIGALLNMLPYIGGLIAIALPVLMATVTKDGYSTQLGVIGAYMLIQFIDNNILVPRIVSSKVQINALISIISVLLGGALWGIAGMFLTIPFVAILKIIFDRVDELKPWGKLLGDEIPTKRRNPFRRKAKKAPPEKAVSEKVVEKVAGK
ncbi:AI-2E family transporter [Hufsiella ginkgonis]|uniref:AI-2E family transporter n=1 Tax=Hufsiella ginkgonis TaxID=2695274 RepID=A0A7K1XUD2_9SPHI|nr:AI-2E family transporter [Hufsiella ginkgonis]MXV14592.1 AI-2E family transporter [Hufsiella ginkgonis]